MSQTLNILQRIRLSVFPGTRQAVQDQNDHRKIFRSLVLHFRPRTVPERSLKLSHAWGLGIMAVVLLFLLLCTGLILKFVYAPFPDKAYDSIVYLKNQIPSRQHRMPSSA